jgi:lipopolysaccharide transport system ATP-binding protein
MLGFQSLLTSLVSRRIPLITPVAPPAPPTLLHVTHWKAGSQWIYRILITLAYESIVPPQYGMEQVLKEPIVEGCVYPTVYLTREELESARLPRSARRFVVIRDLRDTLISLYYSVKVSHPAIVEELNEQRAMLGRMTLEEGLMFMMDETLPKSSRIQQSWVASGEPLIRYEDLLERDVEILEDVLIDRCGMQVTRERLREVIVANRFANITGGRARGQEEVAAHERKGIAGDWRNHFTPRVKDAFKARFGELLIASGYESDDRW